MEEFYIPPFFSLKTSLLKNKTEELLVSLQELKESKAIIAQENVENENKNRRKT